MRLVGGCALALSSGCADVTNYTFSGEKCEQYIVTEMNLVSVQAVMPSATPGSVLITPGCYRSRVVIPTVDDIDKRLNAK